MDGTGLELDSYLGFALDGYHPGTGKSHAMGSRAPPVDLIKMS